MQWIILLAASLAAILVATLIVASAAELLCLVAGPAVRKWFTIFCVMFFWSCLAIFIWLGLTLPPDDSLAVARRALKLSYESLPTWTLFRYVPLACGAIWLVISGMYGILPEPEVAYEPRAANWQLKPLLWQLGKVVAVLLVCILLQDAELCWRLRKMEARGTELAAAMKPAAVPDERNAAKHYQRVVAMIEERDRHREDRDFDFEALLDQDGPFDEKTDEYFRKLEPILNELREASKCDACRYDDEFATAVFPENNHVNLTLCSAMHWLSQYARWQSCRQHPLETIDCIRIMRRREEHLQQDPRNVESEYFLWTERDICLIVQHLAAHCKSLPQAELKALIAKPLPVDSLQELAVRWQAAVFQKTLPFIFDGRAYDRPDMRETLFMATNTPMGIFSRIFLRFIMARDDISSVQTKFSCIDTPYSPLTWIGNGPHISDTPRGYFSEILLSSCMSRWCFVDADTNRTLANIGIAAALYHYDQKAWPTAIEQLTPKYLEKVPVDSESGANFLVLTVEDGLVVYTSREQKYLAKAQNEEEQWRELAQTSTPILFLRTAVKRAHDSK